MGKRPRRRRAAADCKSVTLEPMGVQIPPCLPFQSLFQSSHRSIAQPGSVSSREGEGRRFESCCSDHLFSKNSMLEFSFLAVDITVAIHHEWIHKIYRSVAQSGSAPGLGPGGRRFESCHSDHQSLRSKAISCLPHLFPPSAGYLGTAGVAELVDAPDLGSGTVRCGSSSLLTRTSQTSSKVCGRGETGRRAGFRAQSL